MNQEDVPWCTHVGTQGWSNAGWAWVHPLCGKPTKAVWEGIMGIPDTRSAISLPPRGITTARARIGPDEYLLYTNLCSANTGCYAVAYGKSEQSVIDQLAGHACPMPMRRDLHSGGGTSIQKLWHELDDVIDGIKEASKHLDADSDHTEQCSVMQEKAYAQALAFSLAVLLKGWYRTREDVLIQANKRWKMRHADFPFEVTPGYDYYPAMPLAYAKREDDRPAAPARKATKALTKPVVSAKPIERTFSVDERQAIMDLATTGTPVSDLARLYGVSESRIQAMIPKEDAADSLMGFMF